jgi:outer membrane lipoprotein-sorting protein
MKIRVVFFVFFLLFAASPLFAQDLTPQQLVKRSDDLMRGTTQEGVYTMTITTPSWERTLKLFIASKLRDRILIKILSPAKERGIATLRIKNEMWNYMPSVERTIKIPPSMMLQPWMGSDFANDDLVRESSVVYDYDHKLLSTEKVDGQDVWVVELTPKPHAGVVWDKRIMRIRPRDCIPLREEFYGKDNRLIKTLRYSKIKKISGRLIPTHWEMISEVKKGHRTIIEVDEKVVYNNPVKENTFSLQNLRKRA